MRRTLAAIAAALLVGAAAPAASQSSEGAHWIAYVRAGTDAHEGDLVVVRSDGEGEETLLDDRVLAADVGPGGTLYAVREDVPQAADAPTNADLLRVSADGETHVLADEKGVYHLDVAASPTGDLAVFRQVTKKRKIPAYLRPAVKALRRTNLPILVPPEEPPDTGGLASDAGEDHYFLNFTNDPEGDLSHAEQHNVFVEATLDQGETAGAGAQTVQVRDTDGEFSCGASSCFLSWVEFETRYSVGEFGSPEDAVEFAESLVSMEEAAGVSWRDGSPIPLPQLAVRQPDGTETMLESVTDFCECSFSPMDWDAQGDRLLVITGAEGYTTLAEYRAFGGDPETLREGSFFEDEGGGILDAAYGPRGVLVLVAGEGGPPGTLETLEREMLIEDVRAFDVAGSLLVYLTADGEVIVRDLDSGEETTVGHGAIDVSIGPDAIEEAPEPGVPGTRPAATGEDGFPIVLVGLIAVGALGILGGGALIVASRRRRR